MNILIVEDDLAIADLLQQALEAGGHSVCEIARTVEAALDEVERHNPDCAIVDVHLANGGLGTDFVVRLRQSRRLMVMFSTGSDLASTLYAGERDGVMTKPYLMRDVARALMIMTEMATVGTTQSAYPLSFRFLSPPECVAA